MYINFKFFNELTTLEWLKKKFALYYDCVYIPACTLFILLPDLKSVRIIIIIIRIRNEKFFKLETQKFYYSWYSPVYILYLCISVCSWNAEDF